MTETNARVLPVALIVLTLTISSWACSVALSQRDAGDSTGPQQTAPRDITAELRVVAPAP